MSDYASEPDPIAWQNEQIAAIWATIRAMNGANTAESIVVTGRQGFTSYNPDTGARSRLANGALFFWHDYANDPTHPGVLFTSAGERSLYMYPPFFDGNAYLNSLIISGRDPGTPGNAQLASDGYVRLIVKDGAGNPAGTLIGSARDVQLAASNLMSLDAPIVQIDTPQLGLYSLPTTSAASNLHLGTVGGVWTVAFVTSSRRYKRDIRPTSVKPENVLAVEMVTFLEKSEVDAVGAAAPWRQGAIAEQVAEHTPQFVGLDDDGLPNSVDYDRFAAVGHHVVLQDHEKRVSALEAENAGLRSTVADLTARLEALEAK